MCLNGDCIILTPSALILVEPYSKQKQQLFSVRCWAHLGSLDYIRRYSISNGKLSLYWKCPTDKESPEELTFTLHNSATDFLQNLIKNCIDIGITCTRTPKGKLIKEEDIKPTQERNIEKLLEGLAIKESEYDAVPSDSVSMVLCELYQQAIEYYSALGDQIFLAYVARLKEHLMKKEANANSKKVDANIKEEKKAEAPKKEVNLPIEKGIEEKKHVEDKSLKTTSNNKEPTEIKANEGKKPSTENKVAAVTNEIALDKE